MTRMWDEDNDTMGTLLFLGSIFIAHCRLETLYFTFHFTLVQIFFYSDPCLFFNRNTIFFYRDSCQFIVLVSSLLSDSRVCASSILKNSICVLLLKEFFKEDEFEDAPKIFFCPFQKTLLDDSCGDHLTINQRNLLNLHATPKCKFQSLKFLVHYSKQIQITKDY